MTPIGSRLLRGLLRGQRAEGRVTVAEVLEAILEAEGEAPEAAPEKRPPTSSAERMRRLRGKRHQASPDASQDGTGPPPVTSQVTVGDASPVGGLGGGLGTDLPEKTLSLSGSNESRERERASQVTVGDASRDQVMRLDMPITQELRSIAELQCVQDIAGTWAKFCGYFDGRTLNVAGRWQTWCVDESKRERVQRDREARGGRRPPPQAPEESGPHVREPEFSQEELEAARARARVADTDQDRRAAVASRRPATEPAPAFGGRRT